jgi:hypothetical protein
MNWLLVSVGAIPLLVRRGGRDTKKNIAKPPCLERTGWSLTSLPGMHCEKSRLSDHPVCAAAVAARHFLTGADTPPHEEGIRAHSKPTANSLTASMTAPSPESTEYAHYS